MSIKDKKEEKEKRKREQVGFCISGPFSPLTTSPTTKRLR
jgi:hypothetical protein